MTVKLFFKPLAVVVHYSVPMVAVAMEAAAVELVGLESYLLVELTAVLEETRLYKVLPQTQPLTHLLDVAAEVPMGHMAEVTLNTVEEAGRDED
jgi:Na+/H+ antiporter NhaB